MLETHGGESDLASSLAPRVPSCPPAVAWYCTILQSYNPTHYILCMPPIIMAPSIQYDIQYTIMYFSTLPTIYCAWHPEWLLALEPQNLPSCRQLQMVRSDTETLPLLILLFLFGLPDFFKELFGFSTGFSCCAGKNFLLQMVHSDTETLTLLILFFLFGLLGLDF